MTPTAQGRYCSACQHTVTDFTRRTDAEILALLRQAAGGRVCGRFRAEQLNRELVHVPESAAPRWRAWLLAVAALWAGPAAAQSLRGTHSGGPVPLDGATAPTEQRSAATAVSGAAVTVPDTTRVVVGESVAEAPTLRIEGRVLDETAGIGLPGATVLIKGTTIGVSTDTNGYFELNTAEAQPTLVCSSIGYVTSEKVVDADLKQPIGISMATDIKGELVFRFPWYSPRGWWYRLRALPRRLTGQW